MIRITCSIKKKEKKVLLFSAEYPIYEGPMRILYSKRKEIVGIATKYESVYVYKKYLYELQKTKRRGEVYKIKTIRGI
jgi:hypothetical protein